MAKTSRRTFNRAYPASKSKGPAKLGHVESISRENFLTMRHTTDALMKFLLAASEDSELNLNLTHPLERIEIRYSSAPGEDGELIPSVILTVHTKNHRTQKFTYVPKEIDDADEIHADEAVQPGDGSQP